MNLPERKNIRLRQYDYSSLGVYFVTVCALNKRNLFWDESKSRVSAKSCNEIVLSYVGSVIEKTIKGIPEHYADTYVDKFIVMPNHIHLLLRIGCSDNGRPLVVPTREIKDNNHPTISRVMQQMKGIVTKEVGFPVWQNQFYDHVIRNQKDYDEKWTYIENNPMNWERDDFYAD